MYMLVRFCLPMVELGSFEYACPGYTTVSSSRFRSVSLRLWYIASGSEPGRSTRPHELTNNVSPETRLPSTRKHCDPGVCPGVCGKVTVRSPRALARALGLLFVDVNLGLPPLEHSRCALDIHPRHAAAKMVGMVVGYQNVLDFHPVALGPFDDLSD